MQNYALNLSKLASLVFAMCILTISWQAFTINLNILQAIDKTITTMSAWEITCNYALNVSKLASLVFEMCMQTIPWQASTILLNILEVIDKSILLKTILMYYEFTMCVFDHKSGG